jgi:hypothetical protein
MSHPKNTLREIISSQNEAIVTLQDTLLRLIESYSALSYYLVSKGILTEEEVIRLLNMVKDNGSEE